jgi:ParB family transcriptional regulator, chromosome partitioning protein
MLTIDYRKAGELIPYINNSRTHSDQQVQQVAASIKEFGFTNPILIDEDSGIIAGHGRLQAAQMMGMDEVPTITLEGLTEAQRKAYVIADNKLALNSGWDDELLKVELEILSDLDFDLDILGWDVLPDFKGEIDYSILDDDDLDDELEGMTDDVKKAIQIEFEAQDYEEAAELIKFWRGQGAYVGGLIADYLRKEKNKL